MPAPRRTTKMVVPHIPDHVLLRRIDEGSYGEVWLARNVMGTLRGVKIISRSNFDDDRPYEREFTGIQKYEPVSRTHPGLVAILHVGRNDPGGYFYYVMEIADDLTGGPIDPSTYKARTLANERIRRGNIPLPECVQIAISLSDALAHLHRQGLIHRDIKPSNTIFVRDKPKFADIGLVTEISDDASFVGTLGFVPAEGPGRPTADIYSFGKLLYELVMGMSAKDFPSLPEEIDNRFVSPEFSSLNQIILKACETDPRSRFQSAEEMHLALLEMTRPFQERSGLPLKSETKPGSERSFSKSEIALGKPPQVSILYKSNARPDLQVLKMLERELEEEGCEVFFDADLPIGVEWAQEIENRIKESDAAIVLLSPSSVQSEMIAYELEIADQAAQRHGKPRLLPVRIGYTGPLPSSLATILDSLQFFLWESPADDVRLVQEIMRALRGTRPTPAKAPLKLESIGGAMPLDSTFYVERPADREFTTAISRGDSIVLVKGARQMGKTSLLARGLQLARQNGGKVVLTDFQKLNSTHLASLEAFFLTLGDFLADQLDLQVLPHQVWDPRRSPNTNFERYLRREVLGKLSAHFVWGLDEVDRLFTAPFGSEVFGLFRSWHNERALDPEGPWSRLTLAIAYATEAHLFITDINQSPFNVGTRLSLTDFTSEQVKDLNQRYGAPLSTAGELKKFYSLVGGQPYLVRKALNAMVSGEMSMGDFAKTADRDEGIFGDHLRRILVLLAKDSELTTAVKGILRGQPTANSTSFYRLRSAGVMAGDSPAEMRPRCEIYASYLKRHLL